MDDVWMLNFWVRNATNSGLEYNAKFDLSLDGRDDPYVSPRNFRSYGVQLQYNFN